MLDEFLVRARIEIAMHAVKIFNARRIQGASECLTKVLEVSHMMLKKLSLNACFRHGLAADGVARNIVPEIDEIGEPVTLLVGIGEKVLE